MTTTNRRHEIQDTPRFVRIDQDVFHKMKEEAQKRESFLHETASKVNSSMYENGGFGHMAKGHKNSHFLSPRKQNGGFSDTA